MGGSMLENTCWWWLVWGVGAVLLFALGFALAVFVHPLFLGLEYGVAALFGLWVYAKESFGTALKKFILVFVALGGMVVVFGLEFAWVSVLLLLALLWAIKVSKEEFLWSFGVLLFYGVLGFVPLLGVLFSAPLEPDVLQAKGLWVVMEYGVVLAAGYFVKGAIFGGMMARFQQKRRP